MLNFTKPWQGFSVALLVTILGWSSGLSHAEYRIETRLTGLEHPWSLAFLPDGGMLITERAGRLRHVTPEGQLQDAPVPGLPNDIFVAAQAGLMDVVLANDFYASGELFLSYACGTAASNTTCLARGEWEDSELRNVTELFRAQPERPGAAHYGGRIVQLPDQTLLLTTGDGFTFRNEAQNRSNHIGKIIRVHPDGSVPANNPFVNNPSTANEIFTLGHRNPQGLVYDSDNDRIVSHEHGPRGGDELNLIWPGANYGWPLVSSGVDYSGAMITPFTELPGMESPLLTWTPALAPSGLTYYDGDAFPQWRGDFFIGGLVGRSLRRVSISGTAATEEAIMLEDLGERIRDVRTGPDGLLYLLTDSANGELLILHPLN